MMILNYIFKIKPKKVESLMNLLCIDSLECNKLNIPASMFYTGEITIGGIRLIKQTGRSKPSYKFFVYFNDYVALREIDSGIAEKIIRSLRILPMETKVNFRKYSGVWSRSIFCTMSGSDC